MTIKKINTIAITTSLLISLTFILISCKKENKVVFEIPEDGIELNIQEASKNTPETEQLWRNEDHKTICILFGYGFNTQTYYDEIRKTLSTKYGLTEDGGLIWTVRYPDDLRSRIMNLYDQINEKDISGIILLGAPERTHYMLASIQDYWNGDVPYPIFSFFPQDDILGSESTCDFVLEYEHNASDEGESTDINQAEELDIKELLFNAIHYMDELDTSISYDKELSAHVQNIAGNRVIYRYIDSESGLQSINHFILGKKDTFN